MDEIPVPTTIEVDQGTTVTLTWDDGSESEFAAADLRAACQCATCREPSGEVATRTVLEGPEPVKIAAASLVGGYAINFVFAPDGHGTGIYPFAELKQLADGRA